MLERPFGFLGSSRSQEQRFGEALPGDKVLGDPSNGVSEVE